MSTKLITLVTGANQGIGYYAAQQLAGSGKHHVLLASRNEQRGIKAVQELLADSSVKVTEDSIEPIQLDVTDDTSIARAVEFIEKKFGRLDILVNNAGISTTGTDQPLREEYTALYNTNVFSPVVLTQSLLPLLRKSTTNAAAAGGKRIVFVSSALGSMLIAKDPSYGAPGKLWPIYRSTKAALNMVMLSFGSALEDEGFVVSAVCPGHCGTNLNNFAGKKDPRDGARVITMAIEGAKEKVHMVVMHDEGVHPW